MEKERFVRALEVMTRGEHIYEISDRLLGFQMTSNDNDSSFSDFVNRLLNVDQPVKDYSELLLDVYPYYNSRGNQSWVDGPYLLQLFFKSETIDKYYDNLTRMSSIAGVCYRIANKLDKRGTMLRDDKKVSRAMLFTCAAMLNKFGDSMVDSMNMVYKMPISKFEELKEYLLKNEKEMLAGNKDYQVPFLDSFFIKGKPLVMKNYYKPMYKYKKVAMFDVNKEIKEEERTAAFCNDLYNLLKHARDLTGTEG